MLSAMTRVTLFGLVFLANPSPGVYQALAAAGEGKVAGEYRLNTETCKAGKAGPGCEIYFEIHGAAAKTLYLNMKIKAVADECTGGMVKSDGQSLRCFFTDGKTYDCDVGYNFEKQQLVASDVTC